MAEDAGVFLGAQAEFAGEILVDVLFHRGGHHAAASEFEQRLAAGAAHQRIDQVLRVRHQAENAPIGTEDPGDRAGAAVTVGGRRDLPRRRGVAQGDEVLLLQPVEGRVVGEVVAVAVRHDRAEGRAGRVTAGEHGVAALDAKMAIHRQEAQRGIAQQRAGQQVGFGQYLKSIANTQDVAAARGMVVYGAHDRRPRRHGAAAQVVAETETARDDHQIEVAQIGFLMPDHPRLLPEGLLQGDRHVAFAIDPGEQDDPGFHGTRRAARTGPLIGIAGPVADIVGPLNVVTGLEPVIGRRAYGTRWPGRTLAMTPMKGVTTPVGRAAAPGQSTTPREPEPRTAP